MMETEQSGRVKGVILTTSGDPGSGYHFVSRYFAPWNGIPEDPVTGIIYPCPLISRNDVKSGVKTTTSVTFPLFSTSYDTAENRLGDDTNIGRHILVLGI